MTKVILHKCFKLNDLSFNSELELLEFAKNNLSGVYSFLEAWFDVNDFVLVNTSGSTGIPKSIKLKKEFMINSALATGSFFDLPEKTNALLCLSPNYIAGKMMLVRALVLGWNLDVVEPNSKPLNNVEKEYDFSAMVPMQLFHSINEISKIKKLIVGGGVVSKTLLNSIQEIPTKIYATYGMTETITHIAVRKLNHFSQQNNNELQEENQSNYKVLPNVNIALDVRGCLIIDAPKVADELIITNDLVKLISDEEFHWLGRFDTVINSGGVKLIPEQIEEKLSQIISKRFFVSSIKDAILGEKLILVIESEPYEFTMEKLQSVLNTYETPKKIYFLSQFMETDTKKVDRNRTKNLLPEL